MNNASTELVAMWIADKYNKEPKVSGCGCISLIIVVVFILLWVFA